jgi:hypothetical protein
MLVIEALVLLLILYEVIAEQIRHRTEERRESMLNERVLMLSKLMDRGLRIQSIVPDPQITNQQSIDPWFEIVRQWIDEANEFLLNHSANASAAFLLVTDAAQMDSAVYSSGRHFYVTGLVREHYQKLVVHLENLRRIMGKPEAYF